MPNKPILFLDQYAGLSGGQKVLSDIILFLSAKGYPCTLILPEPGPLVRKIENSGVHFRYLPLGYYSIGRKGILEILDYALRLPCLTVQTINLIRREKICLAYANGARTFPWATLACSLCGIPLIWHVHSIFGKGINKLVCNFFGKFSCVKKIFAVSRVAAAPLNNLREKVEVLYNGVEIMVNPVIKSAALKNEYALKEDAILAGDIAILEEWKNQEDLIRAAGLIKAAGITAVKFFIIGGALYSNPEKQQYKNKLKTMVKDAGLEDTVFFTGFRTDIKDVISSLDMLLICSKEPDPCPLVSLEAASFGLAIISSELGGVTEMFEANTEAIFYTPGNHQELSTKIVALLENRNLIRQLGENAQKKVSQKFNLDNFLMKVQNTINVIINENSKRN